MILYIDETENEKYFIVGGLLVNSDAVVEKTYKSFKKLISQIAIKEKDKSKLFTEFKSSILDRSYPKIKVKMLKLISSIPGAIIYSCYVKKGPTMNQSLKESTYIALLESIVKAIKEKVDIIFDSFNKPDFENNIRGRIIKIKNVKSINSKDSQKVHGLQFIDNICSVIRQYKTHGLKSNEVKSFYSVFQDMVKEVK